MKEKLNRYLKEYLEPQVYYESSIVGSARACSLPMDYCEESSITDFIQDNKEEDTFQTILFKYIDDRNLKDSDVYNKVNIDRRLFSKIRSNKNYHPSKETVILLGIALELTENEIEELLNSASYSLPYNTEYDLIIRFCFKEGIYDINQINEFLYDHNCKTLNKGE